MEGGQQNGVPEEGCKGRLGDWNWKSAKAPGQTMLEDAKMASTAAEKSPAYNYPVPEFLLHTSANAADEVGGNVFVVNSTRRLVENDVPDWGFPRRKQSLTEALKAITPLSI